MHTISLLLRLCLAGLTLTSCAWLSAHKKKPPPEKPAPAHASLIGRVAAIPADRRFVLIQYYGKWAVPSGAVLVTRGPEARTANLLATGEMLGQFAAADIQSGSLDIGDAVFSPPTSTSKTPPPTTPDAKKITPNTQNNSPLPAENTENQ
jgi:hypothetical protein